MDSAQRLKRFYAGELDEAGAYDALVDAARITMDEQIACGLDQIMGGEVFAPDFVHHVPPRLDGLTARRLRDTRRGYDGVASYRVEGTVTAPRGTGHAQAFRRERAIEKSLVKASVPSPHTITMTFANECDRERHKGELVRIVNSEMQDMAAAGAKEIQLDAPHEAIKAIELEQHSAQHSATLDGLADWIAAPFDGLPAGVRRSVHFCLGDISRKPATETQNLRSLIPLIQRLEHKIDRALVECSHVGQWSEHGLLREVPESIEIVAGIADVKSEPQSEFELRQKIDTLEKLLGADRLLVSPSCGCGRMPHDAAIRLTRNLVKAAA